MAEKKRADQIGVGGYFEPYVFTVTPEINRQFLEAMEDNHERYTKDTKLGPAIVHPSLLIVNSNITRSPSFYLPPGVACIHAKEDKLQFINPGRVGSTFTVHYSVVDVYEKRAKQYQVKQVLITDENGLEIIRRKFSDVYFYGEVK